MPHQAASVPDLAPEAPERPSESCFAQCLWSSGKAATKACADITPETVRGLLRTILNNLNDNPEGLRDAIHQRIDRLELSPETFEAVLYYCISPLVQSEELLASPRGFEPRYLP